MSRIRSLLMLYPIAFLLAFGCAGQVSAQSSEVYPQEYRLSDSERERMHGDLERFSQQQPQYEEIKKHRKELRERARQRFRAADTDGNGFLSREEFARMRPNAADHFDEIDQDHDGELSEQEVARFFRQRMRQQHQRARQMGSQMPMR